ncbi:manganese-binding transcriptional regulator MntR [Allorhodopirellula solitaria]|nr:manganese-binding transcriptional regulator MntR [Allorhodopirellula solitaria]
MPFPVSPSKTKSTKAPKSFSDPESHERIRMDHSSEKAEDYVEAVAEILKSKDECRVVDLAAFFGVSHVTVTRIVKRLVGEGLLETEPYRPIHLTTKGKRLATASRKRHEVVHAFLLAIGVDEATAAHDSEGIEHHVSPMTQRCLEKATAQLTR